MRKFAIFLLVLALFLTAGWFSLWRYGPVLLQKYLAGKGVQISYSGIFGNPLRGYFFQDVRVVGSGWIAKAKQISIYLDISSLKRRKIKLFPVSILEASFQGASPSLKKFPRVEKLNALLDLQPKRVEIEFLSFTVENSAPHFQGKAELFAYAQTSGAWKHELIEGSGKLTLRESRGMQLSGDFDAYQKQLSWLFSARGEGLDGRTGGIYSWMDRRVQVSWKLRASPLFFTRRRLKSLPDIDMRGSAWGLWPRLDIDLKGHAGSVSVGNLFLSSSVFSARFQGPQEINGKANVSLLGLKIQKQALPRLDFAAVGSTASHVLSLKTGEFYWDSQPVGRARVSGSIKGSKFDISELVIISSQGFASVTGAIPFPRKGQKIPDFNLVVRSSGLDITAAAKYLPEPAAESPYLSGNLRLIGRDGRITMNGKLHLSAAKFSLPSIGIVSRDLEADLTGRGNRLYLQKVQASVGKEGIVTATGSLGISGPDLDIRGQDILIQHPDGYVGTGRGKVTLKGNWKFLRVDGETQIEEANYVPPKTKPPAKDPWERPSSLSVNLRVFFERNAWYKTPDSAVESRGDLRIKKDPFYPSSIFGRIDLIRGHYAYYGRTFQLQEGSLNFSGEIPANPIFHTTALYIDPNTRTKIYLQIDGPLNQLKISMRSEPPMEERDLVSMLILGRPLFEIGQGTATARSSPGASQEAIDAAQSLLASYLAQGAQHYFLKKVEVDVFQVRVTPERQADFTVGSYITPRLYLSYGQTLGLRGSTRFSSEYALSRQWSLEGRTDSDGKYIVDFLFRYPLRKDYLKVPPNVLKKTFNR